MARLPLILQSEATECGLACLAMTANYHGHDFDLLSLRGRFSVSLKGASLQNIMDMAGALDLGTRALALDMEDLPKLKTPAILHWDINHFVVLKSLSHTHAVIHDPAIGVRKMPLGTVADHFTGVALELTPLTDFRAVSERRPLKLRDLWTQFTGWKQALFQLVVLSAVLQILVLAAPFYLQLSVDQAIGALDLKFLGVLALAFAALMVLQQLTFLLREWAILTFGHQMSFQLIANIFRHLLGLPVAYMEKRHIGDVLSRMASTQPIQTALTQSVVAALIDGLMAIATGVVIFIYSPLLGVIVLISVLLSGAVTLGFYPAMRRAQEETILAEAQEKTHRIESIRAFVPIKLFSGEHRRLGIWQNRFADYINANMTYGKHRVALRFLQDAITGLQTILVVYFGARLIITGQGGFTVGMLFAFMAYRQSFTASIISLLNKVIEFRLLGVHLDRIADITQSKTETLSDSAALTADKFEGAITIKDLSFRYSPLDPFVLDGFNLDIKAGDFVALTGPSGGGKTTLLKLILGLYPPSDGDILIDGQALTPELQASWRRAIGVVMQDDQLLSGTLADNISFFDPEPDMERVNAAARQAHIHGEIAAMPMGYQSMVGDMGSALSGGQKQRVLLARALYKQPQVLFLDEGTANLDRATEKLIVDVVASLPMTRIIVAHRKEFLQRADYTLTINPGQDT